jgi:AcrR family transcriptional regulator
MAASRAQTRRRQPLQSRSRGTVAAILLAAARVFRRERATTNRIAAEAGVGIGSLYEYFPNKQALLQALAVRHLELAESGLAPLLADGEMPLADGPLRAWLTAVQAAVLESQQFPSQALELLSGSARTQLAARATQLRERVLGSLQQQLQARGHAVAPGPTARCDFSSWRR